MPTVPERFAIDRRARYLIPILAAGDPADLLTTPQLVDLLGVSEYWLRDGRLYTYGPPIIRTSQRTVRYRRDAVVRWLAERAAIFAGRPKPARRSRPRRGVAA